VSFVGRLRISPQKEAPSPHAPKLMNFAEKETAQGHLQASLPFNLKDYIDLVDWTGRAIRDDKRGFISATEPKLLDRLGISEED